MYRLLNAHDLITSPAYVVIKAANEFKDKTTAISQLWQTDFTYLKILATVLDDFSRYIVTCPHQDFMDISDAFRLKQEALFYSLAPEMFGNALLVSHAMVN